MKKYHFSLQKVLEYDTHVQNKETDKLSAMKNEFRELEIKKLAMENRYDLLKKNYQKNCETGIPVKKAAVMRLLIDEQKEQLVGLEAELADVRLQIDRQFERLLEVTKDKMTIEKLKEGSVAEYNEIVRKDEETQIDEFIANTAARANI
jgi:flagellar FliJ protein